MKNERKMLKVSRKNLFRSITSLTCGAILAISAFTPVTAHARHPGFGDGHGRVTPVNTNDFHTPVWERFSYNYVFQSGANFRYELGRPTTFNGSVPRDIFSVNTRRDSNVSFAPPSYGVFSGFVPTMPTNPLFQQPLNPHFANAWETDNPNAISTFDTLQQGANFQPQGNPINMFNVDSSGSNVQGTGFLPSTSIGIN